MKIKNLILLPTMIVFLTSCGQKNSIKTEEITKSEFLSISESKNYDYKFNKVNVYCHEKIVENKKKTENDSVIIYSLHPMEIAQFETNPYAPLFLSIATTYSGPTSYLKMVDEQPESEYTFYKYNSHYENYSVIIGSTKTTTTGEKTIIENFEYENRTLVKYAVSEKDGNNEKSVTFIAAYYEFSSLVVGGHLYE